MRAWRFRYRVLLSRQVHRSQLEGDFAESSESLNACSHRQPVPILVLRSTRTPRSFHRVLLIWP